MPFWQDSCITYFLERDSESTSRVRSVNKCTAVRALKNCDKISFELHALSHLQCYMRASSDASVCYVDLFI